MPDLRSLPSARDAVSSMNPASFHDTAIHFESLLLPIAMVTPFERTRSVVRFTTAMLLLLSATPGVAQTSVRPAGREQRIEHELEAVAPAALPSFKAATAAMDRNDYATAVRLFEDVTRQAPRFSPALRRRGLSLVQSGQRDAGLRLIHEALAIERSPEKLISLADALLTPVKGQSPSTTVSEQALRLAQEASQKTRSDDDSSYLGLTAQSRCLCSGRTTSATRRPHWRPDSRTRCRPTTSRRFSRRWTVTGSPRRAGSRRPRSAGFRQKRRRRS